MRVITSPYRDNFSAEFNAEIGLFCSRMNARIIGNMCPTARGQFHEAVELKTVKNQKLQLAVIYCSGLNLEGFRQSKSVP